MKAAATCSNKPLKVSKILFENIIRPAYSGELIVCLTLSS